MNTNANNTSDPKNQSTNQQEDESNAEHFSNPFKDKEGKENPPSPEEEAALEQQRKEAMTERD